MITVSLFILSTPWTTAFSLAYLFLLASLCLAQASSSYENYFVLVLSWKFILDISFQVTCSDLS